jgi:hypothetical protein
VKIVHASAEDLKTSSKKYNVLRNKIVLAIKLKIMRLFKNYEFFFMKLFKNYEKICKTLVRREETKVIIFSQRKGHITFSKIEKGPLPSLSYWHLLSLYIHSSNSRKENPKNRKDSFLVKPDLWASFNTHCGYYFNKFFIR